MRTIRVIVPAAPASPREGKMKPAPFRYQRPRRSRRRSKPSPRSRPRMDACWRAAKASFPSWRSARAARRISSTSTAWRRSSALLVEGGKLCIGACVRHAAFHKPVVEGPLGAAPRRRRASHRALSHPHPRHILRQRRPCRSRLRMVPRRRGARCRDGGAKRRRHARDPAQDFFRGIMTTALARGRASHRGAPADPAGRHPLRLLRVQSPRRRFCARHGAGHLIVCRTA